MVTAEGARATEPCRCPAEPLASKRRAALTVHSADFHRPAGSCSVYWMVTLLKPNPEMFNRKLSPPLPGTLDHWIELLTNTSFPQ